ncbi:MAG: hypothetical protein ABI650_05990 [Dokdonella sp.]
MAYGLRAALSNLPNRRLLVHTANVHAMLERPTFAAVEMQALMGSRLRDLDLYAVNITASDGA